MDRGGYVTYGDKRRTLSSADRADGKGNFKDRDPVQDRDKLLAKRYPAVLMKWLTGDELAHKAENREVTLDGDELDTFSVVGRIVRLLQEPYKYRITLDDGTGQLALTVNLRDSEDRPVVLAKVNLREGMYMAGVVQCSHYDGKTLFSLLHIEEIKDHNRITLNLLEAMTGRVFRTSKEIPYNFSGQKARHDYSDRHGEDDDGGRQTGNGLYGAPISQNVPLGHPRELLKDAVYNFVRSECEKTRRPVSLNSIITAMTPHRVTREEIRANIDMLCGEYMMRKAGGIDLFEAI